MLDGCFILCEGDYKSFDYRIYDCLFCKYIDSSKNSTIIPNGSRSLLMKRMAKFEDDLYCAIIDRDTLTMDEVNGLLKNKIHVLRVRAIENLLVTDESLNAICANKNISEFNNKIRDIKQVIFKKYGKRLNNLFDFEINENNILEYYNPKKVIDTVALLLNMSRNEYINTFLNILDTNELFRKELLDKLLLK